MSHPTLPPRPDIQNGLTQVLTLVTELGDYYRAYPHPRNEALARIALQLNAHVLALDRLLQSDPFSTAMFEEILRTLEPADAEVAARLRQALPDLQRVYRPEDREQIRRSLASQIMTRLNLLTDVGRQLLEVRRKRDAGQSDADIQRLLDKWVPVKVF